MQRLNKNVYLANSQPFTTAFLNIDLEVPLETKDDSITAAPTNASENELLHPCSPVIFSFETINASDINQNDSSFPNCIFWNEVCDIFLFLFFFYFVFCTTCYIMCVIDFQVMVRQRMLCAVFKCYS